MARDPYPSELQDRFLLRMPDGLRGRVARAAKAQNRSMNAEIIALLEMYYPPEPTPEEMIEHLQILKGAAKRGADPQWGSKLVHLVEEITQMINEKASPET